MEIFKKVPYAGSAVEVSDKGTVRTRRNPCGFRGVRTSEGYRSVTFKCDAGKIVAYVHRLVYETFVGPIPEGMVIDHINADRDDNSVVNLRCVTHKENANNPITYERLILAHHGPGYKFSTARRRPVIGVTQDGVEESFISIRSASEKTGASCGNIVAVLKGRRSAAAGRSWKYGGPNE